MRGYKLLHERFWHSKVPDMKRMLQRAGIDHNEDELKRVKEWFAAELEVERRRKVGTMSILMISREA